MSKYDFIEGLSDDFLTCRDMRHAWGNIRWYREPDGTILRVATCHRCDTIREEVILHGETISRSYSYPKGYEWKRHSKEDVRPSLRDFRDESVSRASITDISDRHEIHYKKD